MTKFDYDLITLGAGSGGVRATRLAGGYGAKVAVVENSRVGGTCVMRGCVPKKLLVYGAHFAEDFEDAKGFGWNPGPTTFDWSRLIKNKDAELNRLEGIYNRILRDNNVDLLTGRGKLLDAHTVDVDGKSYTAEKILIAVGGWPSMPDIPGIEHVISSNEALDLGALPRRIVIVGGGYIAVEFAGIFNALGVEVTEIIRGDQILRGFDDDMREALAAEMENKGIKILRETVVRSIEKTANGYSLRLAGGAIAGGEDLETDLVMYATGRTPNTKDIGVEDVGVELNKKGAVVVDKWSKTSVDNIFAVGDATDRVNLTPVAIAEGRAFTETNFNNNPMTMDYENIASAVFSQPAIGSVGLTEGQAREKGEIDVYISRFKAMKHTLSGRDERTVMKLIVERKSDRVVGCHMLGNEGPEIMQALAIALKCGATKAQFDATIGIHPTAAEEFVTMREKRPEHE
ncbi:MAG: glutathione-disulfide reductase [Rhodospirillales bacterium]|jgi:glutathione reductase (NADPH)|nr:glutathione-disulfide reductase [Rhodospirillaceae bacterium]MBT7486771.1 glutathione-disulfide reductase [Rhodospirillales bacterium]MBT5033525.1 glutathione-disulfide reductase [Rhodospirillaceae bacterium]MBT6222059.1 glutathione-disulfide reductase [Rhodospirillaceae bacterium]MBT6360984.1 glutathione-disulfide reductase [Rhodospirillaceae bacterium]